MTSPAAAWLSWTAWRAGERLLGSSLARRLVLEGCRGVVAAAGEPGPDAWRRLYRGLARLRTFQERGRGNLFHQSARDGASEAWTAALACAYSRQTPGRRAEWLRHLIYTLAIKGMRRRVTEGHYRHRPAFVPNLSLVQVATSTSCNLHCVDCLTRAAHAGREPTVAELRHVFAEVDRLNAMYVVLVGPGETFTSRERVDELTSLMRGFPDMIFVAFTNGTLLSDEVAAVLAGAHNLFLLVSLDGPREVNDRRRGRGVYDRVVEACSRLTAHGIPFGISTTVFAENLEHVLSERYARTLADLGALLCLMIRYRTSPSLAEGALHPPDESEIARRLAALRSLLPLPLVDIDAFEQRWGCRARSGSLVYVAADGAVRPCVNWPTDETAGCLCRAQAPGGLLQILRSPPMTRLRCSGSRETCAAVTASRPDSLSVV